MSSLDEYYSKKFVEKEKQAAQDKALADQIEQEKKNKLKELMCRQIIPAMLSAAEVSHPECEKLLWPNHKEVGIFSKRYVDEYYFGWLMDDSIYLDYPYRGRNVYLLTSSILVAFIPYDKDSSPRYSDCIDQELYLNGLTLRQIVSLCNSILIKSSEFGIPTSDLQRWKKALEEI